MSKKVSIGDLLLDPRVIRISEYSLRKQYGFTTRYARDTCRIFRTGEVRVDVDLEFCSELARCENTAAWYRLFRMTNTWQRFYMLMRYIIHIVVREHTIVFKIHPPDFEFLLSSILMPFPSQEKARLSFVKAAIELKTVLMSTAPHFVSLLAELSLAGATSWVLSKLGDLCTVSEVSQESVLGRMEKIPEIVVNCFPITYRNRVSEDILPGILQRLMMVVLYENEMDQQYINAETARLVEELPADVHAESKDPIQQILPICYGETLNDAARVAVEHHFNPEHVRLLSRGSIKSRIKDITYDRDHLYGISEERLILLASKVGYTFPT